MEKKVLESIKELTPQDWDKVAETLVKTDGKGYKEAYNILKEKYDVQFTYNNFYNYIKRNELKIMKNTLLNLTAKNYEEFTEELEKDVENAIGRIVIFAQQCTEAKKDALYLAEKLEEILVKTEYKDKELESKIREIKEGDKYDRIGTNNYLASIAFLTMLLSRIKVIPSYIKELQQKINNLNQN